MGGKYIGQKIKAKIYNVSAREIVNATDLTIVGFTEDQKIVIQIDNGYCSTCPFDEFDRYFY